MNWAMFGINMHDWLLTMVIAQGLQIGALIAICIILIVKLGENKKGPARR